MYCIGGDWDYMFKVVICGMLGYDVVYWWIIMGIELDMVMGLFFMEVMFEDCFLNVFG